MRRVLTVALICIAALLVPSVTAPSDSCSGRVAGVGDPV